MMMTGNSDNALASAKTPRPLNVGMRRLVMTRSNRVSDSASFVTTAVGSESPATRMPSLASTLVIARSIAGSSSTTKTDLFRKFSIIVSKNSARRYAKSSRLKHPPYPRIRSSRGDHGQIGRTGKLRTGNGHVMHQQQVEVEC